jgi:DNA polymerase I-like protein with 3'-5' exonuclease and polymerase domains
MITKSVPIRSILRAPKNKLLLEMDLAQAESWVVAFTAKEENMKQALQFGDIHKLTASVLYDKPENEITKLERYNGKQCNHALAYRMSPPKFTQVYNKNGSKSGAVISLRQAKLYHEKWHGFYNVKSWWFDIEQKLKQLYMADVEYFMVG